MRYVGVSFTVLVLVSAAGLGVPGKSARVDAHGLAVDDGALTRAGEPYRGIGVNCFDLFSRRLADHCDSSYEVALRQLGKAEIPFARFMCCGFWPVDWDLYLQDRDEYFRRLDDVVECAEQCEVGLIASLFWHVSTVPDIVGEPMDQFGDPNSRTCDFIRRYTDEVVGRYRDSEAVWGWEFGNEFNLAVDLPNASSHRPAIVPTLKTATARTTRDELSSGHMLTAYGVFARAVRKLDQHRILITGNSIPRPSAFHNTHSGNWTADSPAEFALILTRDNPDPFDVISVHVYPRQDDVYSARAASAEELAAITQRFSRQIGKPLFVGEFGIEASSDVRAEKEAFSRLLESLVDQEVALAALWVYDYRRMQGRWNVTFDNNRAYMLEMISRANRRLIEDR